MKKYIVIAGIIWLIKKWFDNITLYMARQGIKYGDVVVRKSKDPFGNVKHIEGVLIKKEGDPYVKYHKPINGNSFEPMSKEFTKKR